MGAANSSVCYILVCILSFSVACAAAEKTGPTGVTYSVGGLMSGPYRASVDLVSGVASEALPPHGVHGDGAHVKTADLPVTASRNLSQSEIAIIKNHASLVWEKGAEAVVPRGSPSCPFTMDMIGNIKIAQGGVTRSFEFFPSCANTDALKLVDLLSCASHKNVEECDNE